MAFLTQNLFTNTSDLAESNDGWILASGQTVNALNGNDTISGNSSSTSGNRQDIYGIRNRGTIVTGAGDDTISGTAGPSETGDEFGILGIENSGTITTGIGNDSISGTSSSGDTGLSSTGIDNGEATEGTINTGAGNDTIRGTGSAIGISNNPESKIFSGSGDDTIMGIANADEPSFSRGIWNFQGTIVTGDGDDTVFGSATGGALGTGNNEHAGIENEQGTIDTGEGDDIIRGISSELSTGRRAGIYNNRGTIDTGAGNDIVTGISPGANIGISIGIFNRRSSTIDTGDGRDTITGINTGIGTESAGIYNNGLIDTGADDDIVDALDGGFRGSGTIRLGTGNDILKGFGSGTFRGDNGLDRILLGEGNYTISGGTITSDGVTMNVSGFEGIGGANGGLFGFADGTLVVDENGVATFF